MTNTELLEKRIADSGLKKNFIAEKMGISRTGLLNKLTGKTEFVASEIKFLCDLLGITPEDMKLIFFSSEVDK